MSRSERWFIACRALEALALPDVPLADRVYNAWVPGLVMLFDREIPRSSREAHAKLWELMCARKYEEAAPYMAQLIIDLFSAG